jgi:hypothetical protein
VGDHRIESRRLDDEMKVRGAIGMAADRRQQLADGTIVGDRVEPRLDGSD